MIQITSATSPKSFSETNRMIKNKAKRKTPNPKPTTAQNFRITTE